MTSPGRKTREMEEDIRMWRQAVSDFPPKGHYERLIIARKIDRPDRESLAIRVRFGATGFREWINELQVYLLPNFKHKNIVDYFDTRRVANEDGNIGYTSRDKRGKLRLGCYIRKLESGKKQIKRLQIEYWLMTKYYDSQPLREFLQKNELSWRQMLRICTDIMKGLNYLHENQDFNKIDSSRSTRKFAKSTNGHIKLVAFNNANSGTKKIYLVPHLQQAVVHRNLSSMNILLRHDMTACIWNFGTAHVFYPFQPINQPDTVMKHMKEKYLTSRYSAPEVIDGRGQLTLSALKSADIYSCGILFWELMTRTRLPCENLTVTEQVVRERLVPSEYIKPMADQLGPNPNHITLHNLVCIARGRPTLRHSWLIGVKTNKFVGLMEDLWDHDPDARLSVVCVLNRLDKMSRSDRDRIYKYGIEMRPPINLNRIVRPQDGLSSFYHLPLDVDSEPNFHYLGRSEIPEPGLPESFEAESEPDIIDGGVGDSGSEFSVEMINPLERDELVYQSGRSFRFHREPASPGSTSQSQRDILDRDVSPEELESYELRKTKSATVEKLAVISLQTNFESSVRLDSPDRKRLRRRRN